MATINMSKTRRHMLNLRISPADRDLIDRAAESAGKTRAVFILEAVRRAAEEALLDRTLMVVTPHAHAEFVKRLGQPALSNQQLRRTMRGQVPWEPA